MLGFSALSENPISSVNKVLELSASMTGLAVSSSAAAGTLVGASTMSSSATQTTVGVRTLVHSASLESTSVASSSAVAIQALIPKNLADHPASHGLLRLSSERALSSLRAMSNPVV